MKIGLSRICAFAVCIALLISSVPMLSIYAQNAGELFDNTYITENTADGSFSYKTGDNGIGKEDTVTPVISSVKDYYSFVNAGQTLVPVGASVLPSEVDNSLSPYFPKIGDQGALGACVVFATTYYQFTYTMNKMREVPTNEDNTFSVKWIYNLVNAGVDTGSNEFVIYKVMKQHGCPTAEALPYDGVDFRGWSTDEKVWREAMRYRLKDSQQFEDFGVGEREITSADDVDLLAVKTALNNGDVLKFSSYIYSWEYGNIKTNPSVPENDKYKGEQYVRLLSGYEGGHGMAIVGYNDNIWCDVNNNNIVDEGEMGAFKIANSWSESYGNKGFMWIAYDALNEHSCLEGVEQYEDRQPAVSDVYRIDVYEPNEGNDMYLKYTLNTADRSQMSVSFSADKNGTQYKNSFLNGIGYFSSYNKYSFDGTNTACDATFVYPLNNLDEDISTENFEQYNFYITLKDTAADSVPLVVKNISLVNEFTGTEYKLSGDLPVTVDGAQYSTAVKESTKSNAVIYYIGYDNPTLHYKNGNGDFTAVKMEENSERHGALYKYIVYDVAGDVSLYFSDENGNMDDNGTKLYSAQKGLNFYYTKNQRQKLCIADFDFSNGTPDVSKRCLLKVDVTGGYETYKYKYTIENTHTGELKEYDFDYNYELSPYIFTNEGTYRITVEVMDYAKETAKLTKEFEVKNHPFQIESLTLDKGTVLVSKPVQFASTTAFEGIASYGGYFAKSRFVVKDSNGKVWCDEIVKYSTYDTKIKTTTTVYDFIPSKSGEYTLTVSSEDCNKEYAEKTVCFTVYDMLVGDADGDASVNIKDASLIQRYLAGFAEDVQIYTDMADCDGDESVNIKDASAIQRFIANMTNCGNTGNVIEYIPPTEPTTEPTTQPVTEEPTTVPVATKNTVTFTNSHNWSGTIYCYYWSDTNTNMSSWPGAAMTGIGKNDFAQAMYTFDVPKDATYIIFTNGSEQTVDISYSGGEVRYYPLTTKTGNGYNVNTW